MQSATLSPRVDGVFLDAAAAVPWEGIRADADRRGGIVDRRGWRCGRSWVMMAVGMKGGQPGSDEKRDSRPK